MSEIVKGPFRPENQRYNRNPIPMLHDAVESFEFTSLANEFQGRIGTRIVHLRNTTSTMDVARDLINEAGDEAHLQGTAIFADEQTMGRGRFNRSWDSEPGQDILLSVVLTPRTAIAGRMTTVASLAAAMTVDHFTSNDSSIKWPNDVLVDGRKICGVIAESLTTGRSFVGIVGIGLNVNRRTDKERTEEYVATSLRDVSEASDDLDRLQVARILLENLNELYDAVDRGETIMPEWRRKLVGLGSPVEVTTPSDDGAEVTSGIAEDVDEFGRLLVRQADGTLRAVAAGEVTTRIQDVGR